LICCPDFTAMTLEETKEILASRYPEMDYRIIFYDSPKEREIKGSYTYRVIRQRMASGNKLELTVSLFLNNI
jgi:hypothetical protein